MPAEQFEQSRPDATFNNSSNLNLRELFEGFDMNNLRMSSNNESNENLPQMSIEGNTSKNDASKPRTMGSCEALQAEGFKILCRDDSPKKPQVQEPPTRVPNIKNPQINNPQVKDPDNCTKGPDKTPRDNKPWLRGHKNG
jgi:hypothetical protein